MIQLNEYLISKSTKEKEPEYSDIYNKFIYKYDYKLFNAMSGKEVTHILKSYLYGFKNSLNKEAIKFYEDNIQYLSKLDYDSIIDKGIVKDYIFNCFIGYQVLEKNDFNCIDYLQEIFDKYDLGIDIRAFDKKGKKFFIQYVIRENGTVYHKEYKLSKSYLKDNKQ